MRKYFQVPVNKYITDSDLIVYRPASLNYPKDSSVMFVTEEYLTYAEALLQCKNCLVFWPKSVPVPEQIGKLHAIYLCEDPRIQYCRFFADNGITYLPSITE